MNVGETLRHDDHLLLLLTSQDILMSGTPTLAECYTIGGREDQRGDVVVLVHEDINISTARTRDPSRHTSTSQANNRTTAGCEEGTSGIRPRCMDWKTWSL